MNEKQRRENFKIDGKSLQEIEAEIHSISKNKP